MMIQGPLILALAATKVGNASPDRERLPSGQPTPDDGPPRGLAPSAGSGSGAARLVLCQAPHARRPEGNQRVLLGEPMVDFHRALARRAKEDPSFRFHYVTAREMYNLVRAAEAGWQGTVDEARDYELVGGTPKSLIFNRAPHRIEEIRTG